MTTLEKFESAFGVKAIAVAYGYGTRTGFRYEEIDRIWQQIEAVANSGKADRDDLAFRIEGMQEAVVEGDAPQEKLDALIAELESAKKAVEAEAEDLIKAAANGFFSKQKNRVINLTQHAATAEQRAVGVSDAYGENLEAIKEALTFEELPSSEEINARAKRLARIAKAGGYRRAMIGGAPYLMRPLEDSLRREGIMPMYAFTKRESVEKVGADGSVTKTAVFKHAGFVECPF